jgi:hypothetical protein
LFNANLQKCITFLAHISLLDLQPTIVFFFTEEYMK